MLVAPAKGGALHVYLAILDGCRTNDENLPTSIWACEDGINLQVAFSHDGGDTWEWGNNGIPFAYTVRTLDSFDLAVSPHQPKFVYLLTGTDFNMGEEPVESRSYAFYRSNDGARSWEVASTLAIEDGRKPRIVVDPRAPSNVWVWSLSSLHRSGDRGQSWREVKLPPSLLTINEFVILEKGRATTPFIVPEQDTNMQKRGFLWKGSSEGERWTKMLAPRFGASVTSGGRPGEMLMSTQGAALVPAGVWHFDKERGWAEVNPTFRSPYYHPRVIFDLSSSKLQGTRMYYACSNDGSAPGAGNQYNDWECGGDSLERYVPRGRGASFSDRYVRRGSCLYETATVGAGRWEAIPTPYFPTRTGVNPSYLASFAADPYDPSTFFVANGTDVMESSDGGCTWRVIYSRDLTEKSVSARIRQIVIPDHPKAHDHPYLLIEGTTPGQGALFQRKSNSQWSERALPVTGESIDSTLSVASSDPNVLYFVSTVGTVLHRSDDGGRTWSEVNRTTSRWTNLGSYYTGGDIELNSLIVDPRDPDWLWATGPGA
ncbi:MAG: hypothetical protein ACRDLB_16880, partial [Actinomycetota bacterium]